MATDRRHHVHPETYDPSDPLALRRYQLHKEKWLCDATYCTFNDSTAEARDGYVQLAKELKAELAIGTTEHGRDVT